MESPTRRIPDQTPDLVQLEVRTRLGFVKNRSFLFINGLRVGEFIRISHREYHLRDSRIFSQPFTCRYEYTPDFLHGAKNPFPWKAVVARIGDQPICALKEEWALSASIFTQTALRQHFFITRNGEAYSLEERLLSLNFTRALILRNRAICLYQESHWFKQSISVAPPFSHEECIGLSALLLLDFGEEPKFTRERIPFLERRLRSD